MKNSGGSPKNQKMLSDFFIFSFSKYFAEDPFPPPEILINILTFYMFNILVLQ